MVGNDAIPQPGPVRAQPLTRILFALDQVRIEQSRIPEEWIIFGNRTELQTRFPNREIHGLGGGQLLARPGTYLLLGEPRRSTQHQTGDRQETPRVGCWGARERRWWEPRSEKLEMQKTVA